MMAFGWVVKGKTAGKQLLLLDQSGTRIEGVAVTNKWFAVVDAGGNVWTADRPKMVWGHIEKPCGENSYGFAAIAIANDDRRLAVACAGVGIRIYDITNNHLLTKDLPNSGAQHVAWSPSGDQVATAMTEGGPIRVWRGTTLEKTIDATGPDVWWTSETELVGTDHGELTTWTLPSGVARSPTRSLQGVVAHGARGELMTVERSGKVTVNQTVLQLPDSEQDWISGAAIAGTHAVIARGTHSDTPSTYVIEIDLATAKIESYAAANTAIAIGDGFIVIASPDGELQLRRHGAATKLGNHGAKVTSLAIAGGIVAAGGEDGRITLWSIEGHSLGVLNAHTVAVAGLAFHGLRLASTALDGTMLWDLAP